MIESALEGVPDARVKVYIGGNEFEKIAIFGHKKWQETAAKLDAWFV